MMTAAIQCGNATAAELLAAGVQRLEETQAPGLGATPQLDAELLLAHALGASRARLRSHPEAIAPPDAALRFVELIARRAAGEPIAYILGRKAFWTLEL